MPLRLRTFLWPLACAVLVATTAAQQAPYLDAKITPAARARDLVGRMTLDEKASQLEDWAVAIPRLGIPDYQTWNEALHGVARAGYATVFPQAIGMAATWDGGLVKRMGEVISTEARAKYNQAQREGNHRIFHGLTFWSPNINIFRDPRWGRGQETYGEDPFLTSRMGVAFVEGVQGPDADHLRAVATSKHFAVHSGPETMRHGFDVNVSPRDLEETYLPAFRATVVEGHVQSVMCAYNAVGGWPACTSRMLLDDYLRRAWGFKGFVVSDCGAIGDVHSGHKKTADMTHSAALALEAGTDLSCSAGSPGFNTLAGAVRSGLVSEDLVTRAAERLYTARFQLGMFDPPASVTLGQILPTADLFDRDREIALAASEKSIVLLQNRGVLPLSGTPGRIAVVGPTADLLVSILGNYVGTPIRPVTPLDGMLRQFGAPRVRYAQGSTLADGVAVPVPRTAFGLGRGLRTEFFATPDWTGRSVATVNAPLVQADWEDSLPVPELATHSYSVRWSGTIAAPAPGHYVFSLETGESWPYSPAERYRLTLDGKVLSEGSLRQGEGEPERVKAPGVSPAAPPPMRSPRDVSVAVDFADTSAHDFRLEYSHSGDRAGGGLTLKWQVPAGVLLEEAVARAREADVVVAFVGLSPQLEGEEMRIAIDGFDGGDRTSLDLPAAQQKLLEAVAATGKPLVVVLQSGGAVSLNWARDHAAAILEAWYPGVEGGTAIARTLAGRNNPAGRLPVTFYAGLKDLPAFTDYSLRGRTYRYYAGTPLWGFGYGLSYSTFQYGPVTLSASTLEAGDPIVATVTVVNTSAVGGDEVVEAYVTTPQAGGPIRALAGFERVTLPPGSSREVTLTIEPRALASVDERGNRSILPGKYILAIGGAQPQETKAKSETTFTVVASRALAK